jgi:hypothetical protein
MMAEHSAALAVLREDLSDRKSQAEYLSKGLQRMKSRNLMGNENQHIREAVILRWERNLWDVVRNIESLEGSIKALERMDT